MRQRGLRSTWMVLLALLLFVIAGYQPVSAQNATSFPQLVPSQRVYDETGDSLTGDDIAALTQQIADLGAVGADVVIMVRELDATPDETLDQVEALQQAWVAATGGDQDTTVAILINREPGDDESARAGIYVGRTYHEGNVPESEQRAIVNDELIPPLRDGDVSSSFSNALDRLESSIVNGPPQGAFESWATDNGESWVPWASAALAAIGGAGAWNVFRNRRHLDRPALPPSTARPGNLTPALAGALVAGSAQASAIPATILDLAGRGALTIEPESKGGTFTEPKVQVRLRDQGVLADDVERALWQQLEKRATVGLVSSKDLARIAAASKDVREVLNDQMRSAGWKDSTAGKPKGMLALIGVLGAVIAIFSVIVAVSGSTWWPVVGAVLGAVLAAAGFGMSASYSSLTLDGQEAALPWKAYRDGLKEGAGDPMVYLDFDEVLPDIVSMNLGSAMNKRLKEASEAGIGMRAFGSTMSGTTTQAMGGYFPYWVAFNSSVATSSGTSGSSTVSGGGAGGGGGAAGST